MANEYEQLLVIRSQTLTQLEQLRSTPKPSYSIEGQQVSWQEYTEALQRTVDWCDEKLAGYQPFELRSQGTS